MIYILIYRYILLLFISAIICKYFIFLKEFLKDHLFHSQEFLYKIKRFQQISKDFFLKSLTVLLYTWTEICSLSINKFLITINLNYSTAQRKNTKSASFQGLSHRVINENSVCIRGLFAKQHEDDGCTIKLLSFLKKNPLIFVGISLFYTKILVNIYWFIFYLIWIKKKYYL
jgi:hypothetical protein